MWRLDYSEAALRDFELIFDHLFEAYCHLGDPPPVAVERAAERLRVLRSEIGRLVQTPAIGTLRIELHPNLRFVRRANAAVWFVSDPEHQTMTVIAVFYGAQDHIRHMITRLLEEE
ncbi:MAG: type II toxin-antitoxin system RelE/ParE family toxin [Devosia sp.]|uniref:type II toxin-antitoxin system RelE/ParE family toxin n=1 Tax=Devosia sp. TaxID=1871048 RepID=UPI0024CACD4C|nr:type II toxin-antitoxin system RelE/ParE family toxin [Devosia sp.]UYN98812.1 MAG: type II toxin-antitoxin system RelE/ParE family toxin [Devosia sp.]